MTDTCFVASNTLKLRTLIQQNVSAALTVLIVDDDPAFRYLCASTLRQRNPTRITVLEAGSAEEALEVMRSNSVDCVLVDYQLPDANGAQLVAQIRRAIADYYGPMLILTAGGSEEVAAEAMRAGAADYLPKQGVTSDSLQRAIANAMERANMQRSIVGRNTELERLNGTLSKRNEEIARFYHRISHEIKTPLTAARMFMSMLHEGLAGPVNDEQRYIIDQALESCDQLTNQFNDLIECTRLETGKVSLRLQSESLRTILHRSTVSVRPALAAKGLKLVETNEGVIPPIEADAGRMVQVFANILGNAVKFTPMGGEIHLHTRVSPRTPMFVEVQIRDTGIGISPEHIGHIFDRLYQVEAESDPSLGVGLGLGLTIAKEIVELHRGSITVASELGRGTTFTLYLRTADANESFSLGKVS